MTNVATMIPQPLVSYHKPQVQLTDREEVISPIVWWVVLIIVLIAIAAILALAVVLWCEIHGNGFVVTWHSNGGWQTGTVTIGCSR